MADDSPQCDTFDVLILGAGSAGYAAALRASQLGLSVGLVEKGKVGGTCLHNGCIPTKALLHAAEVADSARESATFGVQAQLNGIDLPQVNAYKDAIIAGKYKGLQGLLKQRKVTVIEGDGVLSSPSTVSVNGTKYTGKNIILATGSYSKVLPGIGLGERIITSDVALTLEKLPRSAIILGGGVIGCEFASIWKSFGVDVTIVEGLPSLVYNEDADIRKALERAFKKRGINFHTNQPAKSVTTTDDQAQVTLPDGTTVSADLLLVAVGREPNTAEKLGFKDVGLSIDKKKGFVNVNPDTLHTGVGNIYAIGDITPGLQLAHRGYQQGIFVAEQIAGTPDPELRRAPVDDNVPRVTYCDPEIASVGMTEEKAIKEHGGENIHTTTYNLAGNGKSSILKTSGLVKLVHKRIDGKPGPIIGVHMIGARMGEQIGEAQLLVNWEAYPEDVSRLIHAHPTQNEALGEAALALAGTPLHG